MYSSVPEPSPEHKRASHRALDPPSHQRGLSALLLARQPILPVRIHPIMSFYYMSLIYLII